MKKILVVSSPFGGHLTILKEFIGRFKDSYNIELLITGWDNIEPDLSGVTVPIKILSAGILRETDPGLWTFPRVEILIEQVLAYTKNYNPDLIFYDFFSLEAYFVSRLLHIPAWSSIPSMVGPSDKNYLQEKMNNSENVKSLENLENKYGDIFVNFKTETVSDGIHIPAQKNIVWSYKSVVSPNWHQGRDKSMYIFVGNIRGKNIKKEKTIKTIYFSLGTVVMNNIWNQQAETRDKLKEFITELSKVWDRNDLKIIFSGQGKEIFDTDPSNWEVEINPDQIECLSRSHVFVTHGGSNSFHEALIQNVPMIVLPFFGDQPLTGERVEFLGLGFNIFKDQTVDTHKEKVLIDRETAYKVAQKADYIFSNYDLFLSNFAKLDLSHESLINLLKTI